MLYFCVFRRLLMVVLLMGACSSSAWAQVPAPLSGPETSALVLRQAALAAYDGWAEVKTLTYRSQGQRFDPWQSFSPDETSSIPINATRGIDLERRKLWADIHSYFPGGYHFHFFLAGHDSVLYVYDADGTRQGHGVSRQGAAAVTNNLATLAQDLPYFAVRELALTADSLGMAAPLQRAGRRQLVLQRFRRGQPQPTYYYFDEATKRLSSIASLLALPTGSVIEERFYDQYRIQPNGLLMATRTRVLRNGVPYSRETIRALRTNQPFDEARLQLPAGYRLAGPPPASQVSQLAPDIYLIDHVGGARNVLFVNLDSSVLVLDPPLATSVAREVLGHIQRTLPGKPVRYVFATHFHADHTLGIPSVLSEGATLIATPATSRRVLQLPRPPAAPGAGAPPPTLPTFVAVQSKLIWGDAHHIVEFHEVKNSHVQGMALVYFPKEQLIYQGDLFTLPEEGITGPALPVTRELARYLKRQGLQFLRMVGHHGSYSITPAILREQLSR